MRRHVLCALILSAIGCSGAVDQAPDQRQLKLAAANAKASGTAQGDPCAQHRWYGDGVCDTFCSDTDLDCVPKGDAVVCAQFIEQSNGKCERSATDACRFQDPDCAAPPSSPGSGGSSGSTPPGGVTCALVSEVSNGSCDRPDSDPCRFQDPDCNSGTVPPAVADCDASKIICQTFAAVVCPDGQVPSVVNGCYGPCVKKESCASPPAGTGGSAGGDPTPYDCDPRNIACQTLVAVTCPDGQVSSVVNHCYGACVTKDRCAPIVCATYIEVSDGTCSRPANDPCRGQDPDCVSDPKK
jgi:hypothetical protein